MMEETPFGDSQSAGSIENYMKQIQGLIRTFIIYIETRLGATIPEDHAIIPWIVKHAAATINRFSVGEDGFTAHRRLRGRNFKKEITEIGESIWCLKPKSKGRAKLRSRWFSGIWLGIREEAGEVIVGTDKGVIKVRTIRRKGSDSERWDLTQLK